MPLIVFHDKSIAFVGALDTVESHRHAAPAVVVGLDADIHFEAAGGPPVTARGAFIAPGARHALRVGRQTALVVYLEPGSDWARAVIRACGASPLAAIHRAEPWMMLAQVLSASSGNNTACLAALSVALDAMLWTATQETYDSRIARVLASCRRGGAEDESRMAAQLCLSGSRLQHLFVSDTGTTLSRYRLWCRMRCAVLGAMVGMSMTEAAIESGFFDSAHFSRSFKDMFGVSPSMILADPSLQVIASDDRAAVLQATTRLSSFTPSFACVAP